MMNAFKSKAKRCCSREYERLVHKIGACEVESKTSNERHSCYRKAARESGTRARKCIAQADALSI